MIEIESAYVLKDDTTNLNIKDDINNVALSFIFKDEAKAMELAEDISEFIRIYLAREKIITTIYRNPFSSIKSFTYVRKLGFYQMREYFINMYMVDGNPGISIIGRPTVGGLNSITINIEPNSNIIDKLLKLAKDLSRVGIGG